MGARIPKYEKKKNKKKQKTKQKSYKNKLVTLFGMCKSICRL
jgi:hypothetical protein